MKSRRLRKYATRGWKSSVAFAMKKNKLLIKSKRSCKWSYSNSSLLRSYRTLKPSRLKPTKNLSRPSSRRVPQAPVDSDIKVPAKPNSKKACPNKKEMKVPAKGNRNRKCEQLCESST